MKSRYAFDEPKVAEINKQLQELSSDLEVGRCSYYDGKLRTVRIKFALKGNKLLIDKLISQGWKLDGREKVITDKCYSAYKNRYDKSVMYQSMRLEIE